MWSLGLICCLSLICEIQHIFHVCACSLSCSNSLQLYRLYLTRLLCPWDFPDKNTVVGCYFLLQGNLPDPTTEYVSLVLQADILIGC